MCDFDQSLRLQHDASRPEETGLLKRRAECSEPFCGEKKGLIDVTLDFQVPSEVRWD